MADTENAYSFGNWEHEDLQGGMVYRQAKVRTGILKVDIPYEIVHHGEMTRSDELKAEEILYELSKLARFMVTFNEIEQTPEGQPLPGGHDLRFTLATSSRPGPQSSIGLGGAYGTYPAKKLLSLAEIGSCEQVNRERMEALKKTDVVEAAKKFEGPIWVVAASVDGREDVDNVGYLEEEEVDD